MKKVKILLIASLLLMPAWALAQKQIKAVQIIDQINDGKAVQYSDVEIVGDLDFTSIKDVELDKKHRGIKRLWKGSTLTYWCHVRVPVSFVNCVFKDDVLAYVHDDDENETYNAIFYNDVDFQGCEFQGKSAFKYVKFEGNANFKDTKYHDEALFKYSKFSTDVSFSNAHFRGEANFKYTTFPGSVYFDNVTFQRLANFKYAKFPSEANFEKTVFEGDADFKYAKFSESPNFDDVVFNGDMDFKYTKVEDKSFIRYLLKKK